MNTTSKWLAIAAVAFVSGSFVASPELRAYAANTVFSSDIVDGQVKTADLAGNAVTAAKIKDGEVKAAEIAANAVGSSEIATDAVGASELQGVTKLVFTSCSISSSGAYAPGEAVLKNCVVPDLTTSDKLMVTKEHGNTCFVLAAATPSEVAGYTTFHLRNVCDTTQNPGVITFSVIVYKVD